MNLRETVEQEILNERREEINHRVTEKANAWVAEAEAALSDARSALEAAEAEWNRRREEVEAMNAPTEEKTEDSVEV